MSQRPKTNVHLHVMLPKFFGLTEDLKKTAMGKIITYRIKRNFGMLHRFFSVSINVSCFQYSEPKEVLASLCDDVLGNPTIAVFHVLVLHVAALA